MWHQLSTKLVQFMAPENPVRPPDVSFCLFIQTAKLQTKHNRLNFFSATN